MRKQRKELFLLLLLLSVPFSRKWTVSLLSIMTYLNTCTKHWKEEEKEEEEEEEREEEEAKTSRAEHVIVSCTCTCRWLCEVNLLLLTDWYADPDPLEYHMMVDHDSRRHRLLEVLC